MRNGSAATAIRCAWPRTPPGPRPGSPPPTTPTSATGTPTAARVRPASRSPRPSPESRFSCCLDAARRLRRRTADGAGPPRPRSRGASGTAGAAVDVVRPHRPTIRASGDTPGGRSSARSSRVRRGRAGAPQAWIPTSLPSPWFGARHGPGRWLRCRWQERDRPGSRHTPEPARCSQMKSEGRVSPGPLPRRAGRRTRCRRDRRCGATPRACRRTASWREGSSEQAESAHRGDPRY